MPHVARRTRRTRMMAHRPTRPGLHLAAMRMSRLRKSFGWRTSMAAAVADGRATLALLPTFHFRLISDKHIHFAQFHADRCLFRIWVVSLALHFRLVAQLVRGLWGLAAPIRYTLMGLRRYFLFPISTSTCILSSCACALILSSSPPGPHRPCCWSIFL